MLPQFVSSHSKSEFSKNLNYEANFQLISLKLCLTQLQISWVSNLNWLQPMYVCHLKAQFDIAKSCRVEFIL